MANGLKAHSLIGKFFNTSPGFAGIQNPEESFNKQIKDNYTEWDRLTMLRAVECMLVTDYSTNKGDFALFRAESNETIKKAQSLKPNDFYVQDSNTLIYQNKYYINLTLFYATFQN